MDHIILAAFLRRAAWVAKLKGRTRPSIEDLQCNPLAPSVAELEREFGSFEVAIDELLDPIAEASPEV